MIKMERLAARVIDLIVISLIFGMIYSFLKEGVAQNDTIYLNFKILVFILGFISLSCIDFSILNFNSPSKMVLSIITIDEKTNKVPLPQKMIMSNILSFILAPISLISILICNKSIGDIVFKTKVIECNKEKNISSDDVKKSEKYFNKNNFTLFQKVLIISILIIYLYIIVVYLFLQKINYYSFRNIIIIIFTLIFFIPMFFIRNINNNGKKRIIQVYLLIFALLIIFIYSIFSINDRNIKVKSVDESFEYYYPQATIFKRYSYDNCEFIVYKIKNNYNILSYEKKDNTWVINNKIHKLRKETEETPFYSNASKTIIRNYDFNFIYSENLNKTFMLIVFTGNSTDVEFSDSIGSKFDMFKIGKGYNIVTLIDGKIDKDYYIKLSDDTILYLYYNRNIGF